MKNKDDLQLLIQQARAQLKRLPGSIVPSVSRRFGDFYLPFGAYRVYFKSSESGNPVVGSEQVVRIERKLSTRIKKMVETIKKQPLYIGVVFIGMILCIGLMAGINTVQDTLARYRHPQEPYLDVRGSSSFRDSEGSSWFEIAGKRITAGDNAQENIKVRFNPQRWTSGQGNAVQIERDRVGSDGLSYGKTEMSVEHADKGYTLKKDGEDRAFDCPGCDKNNFSGPAKVTYTDTGTKAGLATDQARADKVNGESLSLSEDGLLVQDLNTQ
jgi:hypothetical protein